MSLLQKALRGFHASVSAPRLTRFALHPPQKVEVVYADGSVYTLSAEFLRVHSPAADSKLRSVDGEKVIFGRRYVGIMSAEPVGNYGVRYYNQPTSLGISFDDLHKTGIFTWDYFFYLGSNKFGLMRKYIKTLRKHGLTRDPQRKETVKS